MAHYDVFREELAQKFHAYGHALWEPSPGELYGPVAIGDVGYIRRGKFHRIFNVLLPKDHRTHENFGTPEDHEPLQLMMEDHIDTGILSPNDFCSAEVRVVLGGLNIFSLRPEGSAQASFECSKRRGALLSIPVSARREDTVAQGQFGDWITKHIDSWFSFAQSLGLGLEHMEEIILLTGCHRTRSYTNILFSESRDGARVSFGVRVGSSGADITWEVSREQIREVQIQRGPSGDNLSEDQCIFVRGFRVTRFMGIFPARLRAAAGPAPLPASDSHNPPSDLQLVSESTSIPESSTDPLDVLLKYIAEKDPDSDMFLVHDDDLGCIGGAVLDSLQPNTLMDYLRNSQIKTQTHDCRYLAGSSQVPVKVGMLSERALGMFSPIPVIHNLGSKPPDTPLLESAQVPFDSIGSEGSTSNQRITSHVSLTSIPMGGPHALFPLTRDFLTDGYISHTLTPRNAEFYLVHLFGIDAASVQAIRDGNGVYSVFIPPSHFSPPIHTQYGNAWVLDHAVRTGGSVVPQQLWTPQGQGDRRRYVDQVQFRMPIFFVNMNGGLGVPVMNAAAGHMQLRDEYLPPSLIDKTTTKIRIGWPGYAHSEHQVQLRGPTPTRNPIPFDRFVKHVGSRVRQFLMDRESLPVQQSLRWMVGHGNITPDEVMLIGIVQVSEGSWMPILQLVERVVM